MVALAFCNSRAKFSIFVFVWFALVNWLLAAGHEYASGKAPNEPTCILVLHQLLLLLRMVSFQTLELCKLGREGEVICSLSPHISSDSTRTSSIYFAWMAVSVMPDTDFCASSATYT